MELIYVVLISLGTGLVGFFLGAGLGLLVGGLGGASLGTADGMSMGMCMQISVATEAGILTQADTDALAIATAKRLVEEFPDFLEAFSELLEDARADRSESDLTPEEQADSDLCLRFMERVEQAIKP